MINPVHADVGVIVVTYNSEGEIADLLDSLPAAAGRLTLGTVVVDNGSSDSTVAIVESRSDCTVVRARNDGYSAGINRGYQVLREVPALLILNPDARLQAGAIEIMVRTLAEPNTGIVAPRIVNADGSLAFSLRREPTLGRALGLGGTGRHALSEYVTDRATYESPQSVDWALGAVLLLNTRCYRELGGWDESFFLYSEETDFSLRAREAGWLTRYTPDAVAMHIGGRSGQSDRIHSMQIINRVRLYRRRHRLVAAVGYYLLTILSELSWVARGHRQSVEAIRTLVQPSRRPPELRCADRLIPR